MPRGEQEVRERTQREQVRPAIEGSPVEAFRGHEGWSARDVVRHANRGERAEIEQLCSSIAGATDVSRGHVPVHEPSRMDERERGSDVQKQRGRLSPLDRRERSQAITGQQLHRVIGLIVVQAVVEHANDQRVAELR